MNLIYYNSIISRYLPKQLKLHNLPQLQNQPNQVFAKRVTNDEQQVNFTFISILKHVEVEIKEL